MFDMNYSLATKAYSDHPSYHAVFLLHIIQARQLKPLSTQEIEQISKAIIYCGDYFPEDNSHYDDPILPKVITFFHSVLERTTLPSVTSVNDAIRRSCETQSGIPVICPATTTICALYYLNRFRKKFGTFTHSAYVSQRFFLVAYFIAAKFIFANLKSLVTNEVSCRDTKDVIQQQPPYIPTIQKSMPSPPTTAMPLPSDDTTTEEATHFLDQVGNVFTPEQSVNASQLCSMEMEFIHFLDHQLVLNPLQLWSWFYRTLDDYCQLYHTTVGIGSNYVGSPNKKAATAS